MIREKDRNPPLPLPGEGRRTCLGVLIAGQLARARRLWTERRAEIRDLSPAGKEGRP